MPDNDQPAPLCTVCGRPDDGDESLFHDERAVRNAGKRDYIHPFAPSPSTVDEVERLRAEIHLWAGHDDWRVENVRLRRIQAETAALVAAVRREERERAARAPEEREWAALFARAEAAEAALASERTRRERAEKVVEAAREVRRAKSSARLEGDYLAPDIAALTAADNALFAALDLFAPRNCSVCGGEWQEDGAVEPDGGYCGACEDAGRSYGAPVAAAPGDVPAPAEEAVSE